MRNKVLRTRSIITIQRPMLWVLSFVVIISAILLSVWGAFEYGRAMAGYDSMGANAYIEQLKMHLEESETETIASKRQATMLKSNSRIDDDAFAQLKVALVESQDEALVLKKELLFYKSIVAPEKSRYLAIQTVQLKSNEDGSFNYSIMVSQKGRNDKFVRGTLSVRLKGVSKDKAVTLALSDVVKDIKTPMKFGFKYFQNFEGVMNLPATFKPEFLQIVAKPGKGKVKTVDEQFVWSELTAGES